MEASKFLDDQGCHVPWFFFASQIRQAVLGHVHGGSVSVEHDLPERFLDPLTLARLGQVQGVGLGEVPPDGKVFLGRALVGSNIKIEVAQEFHSSQFLHVEDSAACRLSRVWRSRPDHAR